MYLKSLKTDVFCLHPLGAVHPGVRHVPEETMSLYHGWFDPRERPAEECSTSSWNTGYNACMSAVLCSVRIELLHVTKHFKKMVGLQLNWVLLLASLCRSVSQELSETILTMVANCSNVMNKARQPPPGVLPKGRAPSTSSLDAISPVQVTVTLLTEDCYKSQDSLNWILMVLYSNLSCCIPDGPSHCDGLFESRCLVRLSYPEHARIPQPAGLCLQ